MHVEGGRTRRPPLWACVGTDPADLPAPLTGPWAQVPTQGEVSPRPSFRESFTLRDIPPGNLNVRLTF